MNAICGIESAFLLQIGLGSFRASGILGDAGTHRALPCVRAFAPLVLVC